MQDSTHFQHQLINAMLNSPARHYANQADQRMALQESCKTFDSNQRVEGKPFKVNFDIKDYHQQKVMADSRNHGGIQDQPIDI